MRRFFVIFLSLVLIMSEYYKWVLLPPEYIGSLIFKAITVANFIIGVVVFVSSSKLNENIIDAYLWIRGMAGLTILTTLDLVYALTGWNLAWSFFCAIPLTFLYIFIGSRFITPYIIKSE